MSKNSSLIRFSILIYFFLNALAFIGFNAISKQYFQVVLPEIIHEFEIDFEGAQADVRDKFYNDSPMSNDKFYNADKIMVVSTKSGTKTFPENEADRAKQILLEINSKQKYLSLLPIPESVVYIDGKETTMSDESYLYSEKKILINGHVYQLHYFQNISATIGSYYRILNYFIGLLMLIILFSFFIYFYLKSQLTFPIMHLTEVAFEYSRTNFSRQIDGINNTEFQELSMAVNRMGKVMKVMSIVSKEEMGLMNNVLNTLSAGVLFFNERLHLSISNLSGEKFLASWRKRNVIEVEEVLPFRLRSILNEVVQTMESQQFELTLEKDVFLVNVSPIFREIEGDLRGVLLVTTNITSQKQLDQMRNDFIGNVSHDLRSPLVTIKGYGEAIIDGIAEDREGINEFASIIVDEASEMTKMVNNLLNLTQIHDEKLDISISKVDMAPFFHKLMLRFQLYLDNHDLIIKVAIQHGLEQLYLDEEKLMTICYNLVDNAIRYSSQNKKKIQITIYVHLDAFLDELLIEVHDNGEGISKENLPFLFDRFYKVDKTRSINGIRSTGVGLSIVDSYVRNLGGYIQVQSLANKGTTFIIHLPYIV